MAKTINTGLRKSDWYHLDECTACAKHNRASAYRWLGENHHIPALHGAGWLGEDLRRTLGTLELGRELDLDYRGKIPNAPLVSVRRSMNDVISAAGPKGWLDAPDRASWEWLPSDNARRIKEIAFELLGFIKSQRGAPGVILIPPTG